jgi:hypothetical protein
MPALCSCRLKSFRRSACHSFKRLYRDSGSDVRLETSQPLALHRRQPVVRWHRLLMNRAPHNFLKGMDCHIKVRSSYAYRLAWRYLTISEFRIAAKSTSTEVEKRKRITQEIRGGEPKSRYRLGQLSDYAARLRSILENQSPERDWRVQLHISQLLDEVRFVVLDSFGIDS